MAIQGNKRADRAPVEKYVGLFEGKVIGINPTREELAEITGYEPDEDPEYFNPEYELKDEAGNVIDVVKQLTVSIWLQDVKTEAKFNARYYLMDSQERSRRNPENKRYINRHGIGSWGANLETFEQEKYKWFLEPGGLRVGKRGEASLYEFLRSWLLIDFRNDPEAELVLDWARLMRNDVRELRDAMRSDLAGTVMMAATITTRDGENGPVEFQSVYPYKTLPGSYIKAFRMKGRKAPKALEKFMTEITDPENGCKDFFVMEELKVYNPSENVAASDATHIQAGPPAAAYQAAPPPDDLTF